MTRPSKTQERQAEYAREWRARNPDKVRENNRRYRDKNPGYTRDWASKNPEEAWAYRLKHFHKLTPNEYETMWDFQCGQCYLCGEELIRGKVHIDHDHECCPDGRSCGLCRRGLACRGCNWIIGWADESPEKLRRIADNLETRKLT